MVRNGHGAAGVRWRFYLVRCGDLYGQHPGVRIRAGARGALSSRDKDGRIYKRSSRCETQSMTHIFNEQTGFKDENGLAYGVKHVSNKPRVSSMPYLYDIAEGNVANHTAFAKLGYNGDVGATEEDIITQGGVYPWIAAGGIALDVVSSSTDDDVAGTGVQKVRVSYLDADYSAQSQVLDMDGTTPVPLTDTTILRVNSIRATQVGTGGVAAGNITVEVVGGSTVYRTIVAGYTRGRGAAYTVPLGKTLYITSISIFSGFTTAGKVVRWTGRAQVDDNAPTVRIPFFQPFFEAITQDSSFHLDFDMPVSIPATADLKISAASNGAGSFCSCGLRGWLE
jgi:hypothetical protein